ncbi:MAG TPA: SusC/RagA family TonB-linked outer membrane protein [Bacteroidales bacterium]|nr:SusC/RagA family TonB-linked outer membrane protein [Bacteroidales bacterium]
MKKTFLLIFLLVFVSASTLLAQTKSISGTVVSAVEGEGPIAGVSITVPGTTIGVLTNPDGKYSLNVPEGATKLVFSYIGMKKQEVEISNRSVIDVVMESDVQGLSEVVVTAMGISRERKSLGYSVQDVKSEELTRAASPSLGSALQGKVTGVEIASSSGMPGASSKITIRGSRSFTGDNTPLYVVDGMPISSAADVSTGYSVTGADYANRAVDIDPNDIESINVLKGQAASALYGMRASNGVIIITTKSGKGASNVGPEITLNSNFSMDVVSTLPEFQKEFAQGTGGAYNPTASMSWGPKISELPNNPTYGGNVVNAYTNRDGMQQGKYYVRQRALAGLDPWATPQVYNNADEFFRKGLTINNNLNVAQRFDKGNYSLSIGNTNSKGTIPSTGLDRYNIKLGGDAKLSDKFTTGFSGNFISSKILKQSSANNGVVATVYGAPPSYDLAGIPSYVENQPTAQNTYRGTSGFDGAYWAINNNKFEEKLSRFFGSAFIRYSTKIADNHTLDIKYQLGDDSYTTNYTDLWGYGHADQFGEVEHYAYTINELNSLLTGTYKWDISSDLVLDAIVGNEYVEGSTKYNYAYGKDFNFPGWNHIDNASVYNASESYRRNRTVGTFGSISLAYKSMIYFNATGRNDVVSSMPRDNRSFFYPSASLGFIFTELGALKDNAVLDYGKLRFSYAEVGQAGTYYQTYYTTPVYGGGFSSGTPITYPIGTIGAYVYNSTVYDPNLRPQNTKSYEVGADLNFFNGLLSLAYTYSRQNVIDQIFSVPLASSTGSGALVTNGGSIHTNAHEFTLGVNPIRTQNIDWNIGFNFSKIDNYVDELAPGVNSIFLGGFTEPQVRAGIGSKFPVLYGVSYLRNKAGQIVVNANGYPQPGEEKVIGTVSPDFILGLNTTLNVYKFRLSALFDWKSGGQMYSGTSGLIDYYGVSQISADKRKSTSFMFSEPAVKVTGTDGEGNPTYAPNDIEIPGTSAQAYFNALNNISESMIYDNSFIKLREVSLSYPVLTKQGFNLNINLFARNLLLWTNFESGLDPEATQGNNNMSGAFERFSLPGSSSYGLGLNVKF